jgi:hypothetical protein
MKLPVDRKEDIEIARQPGRYPVVKANRILSDNRRVDLLQITGLHTAAKDRPILSENCLEEATRMNFSRKWREKFQGKYCTNDFPRSLPAERGEALLRL